MSSIHGLSHKAISAFRDKPAALAVYWIYVSRTNVDGVAWPTLRGLVRDTGWSINACKEARKWLVEHGALETIDEYIRPKWRKLEGLEKTHVRNLDQSEYYKVTGTIMVDTIELDMLYFGGNEDSDIEDDNPDDYTHVSPHDTSVRIVTPVADVSPQPTSVGTQQARRDTELGISINLDSKESNLGINSNTPHTPAPNGAGRTPISETDQSKGLDWNKYLETLNATKPIRLAPSIPEKIAPTAHVATPPPPISAPPPASEFDKDSVSDVLLQRNFNRMTPAEVSEKDRAKANRFAMEIEPRFSGKPENQQAAIVGKFFDMWDKKKINGEKAGKFSHVDSFKNRLFEWLADNPQIQPVTQQAANSWQSYAQTDPLDDEPLAPIVIPKPKPQTLEEKYPRFMENVMAGSKQS